MSAPSPPHPIQCWDYTCSSPCPAPSVGSEGLISGPCVGSNINRAISLVLRKDVFSGFGEMAQWVKAQATERDNLTSIPETHMVGGN